MVIFVNVYVQYYGGEYLFNKNIEFLLCIYYFIWVDDLR